MNKQNILVSLGIGLVAVVASVFLGGTNTVREIQKEVHNVNTPATGALSSPDIQSPYLAFGGVRQWAGAMPLATATNTICLIQAPAATSTLREFAVNVNTSSTSATQIILGKGTAQATTTALSGTFAVAANAQILVRASSTPSDANASNLIIAPNAWLVASMVAASTNVGTVSPTGSCVATFIQI